MSSTNAELSLEYKKGFVSLQEKFKLALNEEMNVEAMQNAKDVLTRQDEELLLQKQCNRKKAEVDMYAYIKADLKSTVELLKDDAITQEYLNEKYDAAFNAYQDSKRKIINSKFRCE
ncbi:hypothetical protein GCM10025882_34710 [Acinetobacter gyllenbergii]|uniref:Uncharacterized protein n=1 Tax=Acinetobacter gyllenbergii CIP 110306 = MTCC 11365 TaxID=1217657 RepID=A0A829HFT0_9GAMM|nr:hypothetical protein [Acinetobacter gyllenbergii]EPF80064.1 hypothetical protein F957_02446 [Acinetobacter gyllenbergii CIP 110306 = MTCC 11365]EPH32777.1 hypothetical protein L293_1322 [Acinetobacter gyllenbergii CIP 110306 = MTCC 11365]ESK53402.1 hypothetical protein F987_01113 [Acinetobacter gyllenbergii NIPH 230]MCU4580739.1 hypothetical protein [Acinetobacter gyllenbergii]OBY75086.1 hypothetical protein NG55_07950 [Acinetobacter gyllenbergii]